MTDIDDPEAMCVTKLKQRRSDGSKACEHLRDEHGGDGNLGPCKYDDCEEFTVDEFTDDEEYA